MKKLKKTLKIFLYILFPTLLTLSVAGNVYLSTQNQKLALKINYLENQIKLKNPNSTTTINAPKEVLEQYELLTKQDSYNLVPYQVNISNSTTPFTKYTLKDSYVGTLHQYNLPLIYNLSPNEKINYIRSHSSVDSIATNEKATLINSWDNIFHIESNQNNYAFSTDILKTYNSIQLGIGYIGSGNIITIHKYFDGPYRYKFYILTNYHVAKIFNLANNTLFINHDDKFYKLVGEYKNYVNTTANNDDLAVLEFDTNLTKDQEELLKPYIGITQLINGINYNVNLVPNQIFSTKLLVKSRLNGVHYLDNKETVILNPFTLNGGVKDTISMTLDKSFPGVSGSKLDVLYRDKDNNIVPVIYGIVSGGYLSPRDNETITYSKDRSNLDFAFSVDNNFVGISFAKTSLYLLKDTITSINNEYKNYLETIMKGENNDTK